MSDIDCNESNDKLSSDEFKRIQDECIKRQHISPTTNLKKLIENDEKIIMNLGITFEQLSDFFQKIRSHFNYGIYHKHSHELSTDDTTVINSFNLGGKGWSRRFFDCVTIFDKIIVCCVEWNGAEICPFKSPLDKQYRGHCYGCKDWIFINKDTRQSIHVGDLLFHQISKHHFFQNVGKYRVDPTALIKFFNIRPGFNYETQYIIFKQWTTKKVSWYKDSDKHLIEINDVFDDMKNINNDDYTIYYDDSNIFVICQNAAQFKANIQELNSLTKGDLSETIDLMENDMITYIKGHKIDKKIITVEDFYADWI